MAQDEMMAKATLVQNKYTDELMNKPHVMGVGLGQMPDTGETCIVVMVDQKVPQEDLPLEQRIPEELDGVKIDIREIGIPTAY